MYSKILVTGCGGDIGLAIGKILKDTKSSVSIIGCDITADHAGKYIFDQCCIVDKADSENYMKTLLDIIEKEKVDVVIPTSEQELRLLCEKKFFGMNNLFLAPNLRAMEIGFDKLATAEMLKTAELPYPKTKIITCSMPDKFPCIVKSRAGCGSKDVIVVEDHEAFEAIKRTRPNDIWQEYLLPEDQEYTCGVYRASDNDIRTIIMKRKLKGDCTGSGIVVENNEINRVLHRIAEVLDLKGSINVQLRLTDHGPVVFEINPRFSSTVGFRHKMGFQDVIWALNEKKGLSLLPFSPVEEGIRFYRIYDEVVFN